MKRKTNQVLEAAKLDRVPTLLQTLLRDETIGGKMILGAALLALIVANSPLQKAYHNFWDTTLSIGFGQRAISMDLTHWVSEGLMAIFFLVVGLEIKRELVRGELRRVRTALLPIGAAIGGMVVPAIFFLAITHGQSDLRDGWAIPMATDIAFALAVISLLGSRVSSSLKIFLLTLAIVDDIGAITIIALFYNSGLTPVYIIFSLGIVALILLLNRMRIMSVPLFIAIGVVFWVVVYKSGIHASIAGAALGLLAPLALRPKGSVAERLEELSIPISTFTVVPLFAFASLGITLSVANFNSDSMPLVWGIIAGLVVGKVIGITFVSWLLVKTKLAVLPDSTRWSQILGVGFLAGIGFTVSVFITELAFVDNLDLTNTAKMSVLIASTLSAIIGYMFLRHREKVTSYIRKGPAL